MTKTTVLENKLELDGFKKQNGVWRGNCPWRSGSDSQGFVVALESANGHTAGWFDHVTDEKGKLCDLAAHYGIDDFENQQQPKRPAQPEYIYRNEAGAPVYKVIRGKDKKFLQKHFCKNNKWVWGLGGNEARCDCEKIAPMPFCLPELIQSADPLIIVCEGEKDVLTAQAMGFTATCNSGGAGKWRKMPESYYSHFENRQIIIIADNDEPGEAHAADVAQALQPIADSVKVIKFDGPKGADLTDWAREGGTKNKLLEYIANYETTAPNEEEWLISQAPDDEGNAQCVNFVYQGQFLYTDEIGWLRYTGSHWEKKGADAAINRAIVDTLTKRRLLAVTCDNEKLVRAAKPSATNVKNAKFMLQSILWTGIEGFDNNPDTLNCLNGVVDLRNGNLTRHKSEQRFTSCLSVNYNPLADDSQWTEWLHSSVTPIGADDNGQYSNLVLWLQMAIGYSFTGHTHEQCLFFLQGEARAGKGVLLQILHNLLGRPLASSVDFDTFTAKRGADNQNFDLAPLKSCRLITASESDRSTMINAKRVKGITGNDPIYCAHKRKEFFTYTPQFKIWLASNFKIMAQADDDALWSRLRIINFPNSHLGNEDYGLQERLWGGREGILKWAVEGAIAWYKQKNKNIGLDQPEIIKQAVVAHRQENDTVGQFLDENCIFGETVYIVGVNLTASYREWCKENGINPLGGRRLSETLLRRGYVYKAKRVGGKLKKCWIGLGFEV